MNARHEHTIQLLVAALEGRTVCALTGAGMSTGSGIPDYRGPRSVPDRRPPIQFHEFRDYPDARARYWSRSVVGWPWMMSREPNPAHRALARIESAGVVDGVITQNVDGLHQKAGSQNVLELHGNLNDVICMECGTAEPRLSFQRRVLALNPSRSRSGEHTRSATIAPDGDAEPGYPDEEGFIVPTCTSCRGVLKPNVVFFGESVPQDTVSRAFGMVDVADTLLVLGSSLTVFSGFRFVRHAHAAGKRVVVVNQGSTRGDALASLTVDAALEATLPAVADALDGH